MGGVVVVIVLGRGGREEEEGIEGRIQGFTNHKFRAGALLRGLGGPALPQINHCFLFFSLLDLEFLYFLFIFSPSRLAPSDHDSLLDPHTTWSCCKLDKSFSSFVDLPLEPDKQHGFSSLVQTLVQTGM